MAFNIIQPEFFHKIRREESKEGVRLVNSRYYAVLNRRYKFKQIGMKVLTVDVEDIVNH